MLDLDRLSRIRLSPKPRFQRLVGWLLLTPNYRLPPRVRIDLENDDRIPDGSVIYAMNHTDRYNYWPFQYALWRAHDRYTATWVKAKYYENRWLGRFMEWTNNIPTPSRGYVVTRDFIALLGRRPTAAEYRFLRGLVDAPVGGGHGPVGGPFEVAIPDHPDIDAQAVERLFRAPRSLLGLPFDPTERSYPAAVDTLMRTMMERFVDLNAECFEKGLDLLVFPQGTRSKRLSRGHVGLAQIALKFKKTIVPVGCSGSDQVYPSGSPWAKGGHIVYRVGTPIRYDEMGEYAPPADFQPFTEDAQNAHGEAFQALVDLVMTRINGLLDEPYRFADDQESQGVSGTHRFV